MSASAPPLSVILPAYNEAARLAGSLETLRTYLDTGFPDADVVVVSDGSTDATDSIAARYANEWPNLRLLSLPHQGKGHAVRAGMLAARGAVRIFMDVDLAVPVETIAPFVEAAHHADVVIGSRDIAGAQRLGEPVSRRVSGRLFRGVTRVVLGLRNADTQCGFKAFRAEAAERLFAAQTVDGFGFDAEILYLAYRWGLTVEERPVTWRHQEGSTVRLRHGPQAVAEVIRVKLRR